MTWFRTKIAKTFFAITSASALAVSGLGISSAMAAGPAPAPASNIYGCVTGSSRTLEHVFTIEKNFVNFLAHNKGKCPNGFPFTVETNSNVAPPPPTPTPTPTTTTAACTVTTDDACGPYNTFAGIQGTTGDIEVDNHIFNEPDGKWSQVLRANDPAHWSVTTNFPAGDTSVHSFPNTGQIQDWIDGTELPASLSTWSSMTSSWNVTMPADDGKTAAEAAYDLWFNDWNTEVMIQTDFVGDKPRPRCDENGDVILSHTFGGHDDIPAINWNLCKFDDEIIWQPATGVNYPSGKVDIMEMINWLVDNKYLSQNPTFTAWGFGFEICTTGSKPVNFTVNDFSFVAKPSK